MAIPKCYQSEPKFNGVYSGNNLPKIKDGAYVINLDEFKSIETHWIALYVNSNKDETRNVLLEQIKQNELMSKKPKKVCTTLNYLEHFCILASGTNGCFSFCAFASLLGTSICITSSAIGLKLCVINK